MKMNKQSYREHIMNVHPKENPLDLKVYGQKTLAETMALLRGSTVTLGRLRAFHSSVEVLPMLPAVSTIVLWYYEVIPPQT